jgi:4-hydroxybenzoate polyprenyltransferase
LFLTVHAVVVFFTPIDLEKEWLWMILGVVAVISFFYRLRVFDEIKDYDLDAKNYPQRVLQAGRVTKKQLIFISILGTVVELLWSMLSGWAVVVCWLVAVGYSLLMRYEFFIGSRLNKHLLLYAITHMLVMPLIILWVYSSFHPKLNILYPFYVLAGLSLVSGFSFEIARKIHAPVAEKPGIDSYSKSIGYAASITLVLLVLTGGVAIQIYLLNLINARLWAIALISIIYFLTLLLYFKNVLKPSEKSLRTAEKFVSLFMLGSYLSIIIEVHFNI